MNIRAKLTLRFTFIVAAIILLLAVSTYFFSADYRKSEFYGRLKSRGINTAKLLIDVDEVDTNLLRIIDKNSPSLLVLEDVIIVNPANEIIYCNCTDSVPMRYIRDKLVRIWLNKEIKFNDGDRESIGFVFQGKNDRYIVIASAFDKFGLSKLSYLRLILMVGCIISISLVFIGGWIFAGQALRPMSLITSQADKITASDLKVRLPEGNKTDELAHLAITFNRMLDRLEKSFEVQRSFVSDSSHELRTPLTAMRGQIEVSLLKERSATEYKEILVSVLEDISNMIILLNNLLDIARTRYSDITYMKEKARVDEQIFLAREELMRLHPEYNVNVSFASVPDKEEKLSLAGSEQLLRCAFMNLMENGCKYSQNHKVEVLFSFTSNGISMEFIDNGIGIPESALDLVTNPFFRAPNAIQHSGHGLGLTLTAKIVELHRGTLEIFSAIGKGTTVKVFFSTLV